MKTNTTSLCPEHSVPVDDAATCQAACDQLGLKFHEHKHLQNGSVLVYRKGASKHPKGCFMNSTVQHNNTFSACLINADQGGVSKHHKETEPRPVCIPGVDFDDPCLLTDDTESCIIMQRVLLLLPKFHFRHMPS